VKDSLGQEVSVGDTVVYLGARIGKHYGYYTKYEGQRTLQAGVVEKVTPKGIKVNGEFKSPHQFVVATLPDPEGHLF
jgi:hypothetical protein